MANSKRQCFNEESKPKPREWFKLGPFVVFDTETTGMSPTSDAVIEVAAVRIGSDGAMERFATLVDPGRPIPPFITRLTGITDEMVRGSPDFGTVGPRLVEFASGATLVAHNAQFDLGFLQAGLAAHAHQPWQGGAVDTIPLARQAYPGLPSYSLEYLRRLLCADAFHAQAHRAEADAEWTAEILGIVLRKLLAA